MKDTEPITDTPEYSIHTIHGQMKIKSSDIINALKSCAAEDVEDDIIDEDLKGWEIVYASDEFGKSRPLFLMRVLPSANYPVSHNNSTVDDSIMADLILKDVYKLTPFKIKTIKIKYKIMKWLKKIFKGAQ